MRHVGRTEENSLGRPGLSGYRRAFPAVSSSSSTSRGSATACWPRHLFHASMSYFLRITRAGENRYPDTAEIMEPVPKSPAGIMSRTDDVRASQGPTESSALPNINASCAGRRTSEEDRRPLLTRKYTGSSGETANPLRMWLRGRGKELWAARKALLANAFLATRRLNLGMPNGAWASSRGLP